MGFVLTVRLRPFGDSTLEERSRERHRRIALTALSSVGARGVSVLTSLITVPLTVGYLGTERYGLWMTISSVIAMLSFADLGMGNGLLNAVSDANGRNDRAAAQRYISSTFFMLLGVASALALIFAVLYPLISWQRVFNVSSSQAVADAGPAMAVFVGCFLCNLPLGIVQRVQLGYQEGFRNSAWQASGNLLGLAGVLLVIHLQAGLPWLVLAMAGAPVITLLLNGAVLFGRRCPWARPRWSSVTGSAAQKILGLGALFFALQIAVAVAYSSDNIVAAQVLGSDAVTQYSVPMRLFSVPPVLLGMILGPLWPAYAESLARGDRAWARKTLVRSLALVLSLTTVASAFLVVFGAPIVRLWVGPQVSPTFGLLLGLGVWMIMQSAGNAVAMFLNAAHVVGFQVVTALLMAVTNVLLSILLARNFGLPGIIWGTVIAYTAFSAIPTAIYMPRLLRRLVPPGNGLR